MRPSLLVVCVGLMHTCHVGRLAGLGIVGAALPELNGQSCAVLEGDVVLDDVDRVAELLTDAVMVADEVAETTCPTLAVLIDYIL